MSDRDLYGNPQRAIAGQTHGLTGRTRTYTAGEKIFPGDPLFGMVGDNVRCYRPHVNAVTLSASEALVTGNVVTVTVNGITFSVQFTTSSANTISLIVQQIGINSALSDLGITAFVVQGVDAFTVVGPGIDITASAVVTGGEDQATFSAAADTNLKFIGIAEHTELTTRNGTGFYDINDSVNVRDWGDIYVPVADDAFPADKEPAYIDVANAVFTDISGSNYDCGCYFRSDKQDGLALIEVRGMK